MGYVRVWGVVVPGQFYEKAMQAQAHRTIRSGVYCGPGREDARCLGVPPLRMGP